LRQFLPSPPGQDHRLAEAVLALAVLVQGQIVPATRFARLDLARPRHAEALHRAPLRLQLRHLASPSGLAAKERRVVHGPLFSVKASAPLLGEQEREAAAPPR